MCNVGDILKDFGVAREEELSDSLLKNWSIARCTNCGDKIDLLDAKYIDGDPVCKNCYRRLNE